MRMTNDNLELKVYMTEKRLMEEMNVYKKKMAR